MKHAAIAVALSLIALLDPAGGVAQTTTPSQYQYDTVTVTLPKGDREAGRRAFRDLKCYVCHRVAGDTTFPPALSDARGPDLDSSLGLRPASDLAAAIIVPSHSVSVKTSPKLKERLRQLQLSPMGDFSGTLTVRQLADLMAYLGAAVHGQR
jgi:cytochrome c2